MSSWSVFILRQIGLLILACLAYVKSLPSKWHGLNKQLNQSEYTIYPISRNDEAFKDHVKYFAFKVDQVLDPSKIQSSLEEFLDIGHWRKLAGRIKLNEAGRITLHVPKYFDEQNPAFSFHHDIYNISIDEHSLAAKFPPIKQTRHSVIYPNDDFLAAFARTERAPKTIHEFVKSERPVMSVLVSSFADATIVGLCWPHILMDGIGFSEFLRNWSLVLANQRDLVAELMDINSDPMWEAADAAGSGDMEEDWALSRQELQGINLLRFKLRYACNAILGHPPERRMLMLSCDAFQRLVEKTRMELKKWGEEQGKPKDLFISEGDILTAWIMKAANKYNTGSASRPIILGQAFNLRPYLLKDHFAPSLLPKATGARKKIHLSNMVSAVYAFLPRGFLQSEPVFRIALEQRKAVEQQTTEAQVLGLLRHHRNVFQQTGKYQPVFGTYDSDLYFVTNAIKLQLQHMIDFSPAVIQRPAKEGSQVPVRSEITSYVSGFQNPSSVFPGIIILKGRDRFGNIWMNPTLHRKCWKGVEEEIDSL